jgi:amino acid adenylation domain-containing protein/non-ribosomal peptide synthase protein (TIGR01720 family)
VWSRRGCRRERMSAQPPGNRESVGARISQLSADKREFLASLLKDSRISSLRLPIQRRAHGVDVMALSFAQQRLWFLDQLEPNSSVYNVLNIISPPIPLHVPTLQRALDEIVRRHEILRTRFVVSDGEPEQVIIPALSVPVQVVDAQDMPRSQGETQAMRLAAAVLQRPFDLTRPPLLRVTLVQLAAEQMLLLTMHHIITDGWSIDVFRRELRLLYEAFSAGRPSPLPAPPIQYGDFAIWQRQWLEHDVATLVAYWKQQLGDTPSLLELPTDRPRPAVQTSRGATETVALPRVLADALKALSRREKVTLFETLLAAFQVLLCRYTGQSDISVGTPVANRSRPELSASIGFFVNTLVLRTSLSGNPSFRELLGRVRATTTGAYANQEVPFERLVDALRLPRDLSRTPLFQVMFEVQEVPADEEEWTLLSGNSLKVETRTAKFDLTLKMLDTARELIATIEYNADLFEPLTIARMLGHFRTLLEDIVANPEQSLSELRVLPVDEQHRLLYEWNDTDTVFPQGVCIHQLFEAQAERTPDAVAVICEEQSLTYRVLDEHANRMARYLRTRGVRPGMLVGICVERSIETVIGLFGILKAGAAYVPLDPAYPKERLAFMLADSHAPILLTQNKLVHRLPQEQTHVISIDGDWEAISRESARNIAGAVDDRALAYVIYTSGSAGAPKGVMITHRAALNTVHWLQDAFALGAADVVAQKTATSFTDSVWEYFWPLITGARLAVIGDGAVKDPQLLQQALRDANVTVTQFVPPLMAMFLSVMRTVQEVARLPQLKWVFNGGEALHVPLAQEWYSVIRTARIANIYGMTESAVYATLHIVAEHPDDSLRSVPIGRPIANAKVYILDNAGHLCPAGVSGEISIGGLSLAEGYLDRASLTAERFVPDPFSRSPGARLYKTGDLGRQLSGGSLEYLGRVDHQVKIRGFRVELGEIEAILGQHPAIREVTVVAREDESGGAKRLVAYVVAEAGHALTTTELRRFLQEKLPDYMNPAVFVWLPQLPLTPNGKVDRRSLPEPAQVRPNLMTAFAAPQTAVEMILADIWTQVLRLDNVGVHDNFFDLGGDSILTIQIVARANRAGLRLTPRQLFQQQTIAELAKVTSVDPTIVAAQEQIQESASAATAHLIAAESDWMTAEELPNVEAVYPVTPLQAGLIFHTVYGTGTGSYVAQLSFRMRGVVDAGAWRAAWAEVVQRQTSLRTGFVWKREREPVQVVYRQVAVPWEEQDWRGLTPTEQDEQLEGLRRADRRRGFELPQAPLLRLYLIRLEEGVWQVVVSCHHLVLDGWSFAVVVTEVCRCYEARCAGVPVGLEPARPFGDYIAWLQQQDRTGAAAYWRQALQGFRTPTVLRVAGGEGEGQGPASAAGYAEEQLALSAAENEALARLGRRERLTLSTLVQGGWAVVLGRYSGSEDVMFGTTVAGRPAGLAGVETMVGLFINTLPQRVRVAGEARLLGWLQALQTQQLERQAYEDSSLVEVQGWSEVPRGQPLFESLLVVENYPVDAGLQRQPLRGVTLEQVHFAEQTNYPLTLVVVPGAAVTLRLLYDTGRYAAPAMRRLLEHLATVLGQISRGTDVPLAAIALLPAAEHAVLMARWSARAAAGGAPEQGLHQIFEGQVERTPDAVAAVYEDQEVTYGALNRRANQLAHHLRRAGVGPEVLVGICLERSLDLVVAILGVLKAGGAYVALDPAYPPARLARMLTDSGMAVVVTADRLAGPVRSAPRVVRLDTDGPAIARERASNPDVPSLADQLAYVIYTSGSTGVPKGVMVSHGNVQRLLTATAPWCGGTARDVWTLFHSYAFDFSVWELWGALSAGGRLVVVPYWVSRSPAALYELIVDHQVTVLNQTPSAFYQLQGVAAVLPTERVGELRLVIFGGEALDAAKLAGWLERYGDEQPQLVNMYGITETTVHVTYRRIRQRDATPRRHSAIGDRIPDLTVYVLDAQQRLTPVGLPGELYVGGGGLARGYLGRPELTAERFVVDGVSGARGARLYKTGDQGSYAADGGLDFWGRLDDQVKLRGFRVEVGEIEAVLRQHPGVDETVVVVWPEAESGTDAAGRLVAYCTAASAPPPSTSALHHFVKTQLPDYMVPAAFVWLVQLPRTANGKVDKRALPAPTPTRPEMAAAFEAPHTAVEQRLATIWAEVLGLAQVGIHDNFFELGGDSILSLQIIARANQAGLRLTPKQLFEHQTVAQLALQAGTTVTEEAEQGAVAGPVPLTPIQHWFFEQAGAAAPHFNHAVLLTLRERWAPRELAAAVAALVAHHDALRLRFRWTAAGWRQFNAQVERNAVCQWVDLGQVPSAGQGRAVEAAAAHVQRRLDLETGPLLRVVYFDLGRAQPARLLIVIHHLAVDGVSWRILLEDLQTLWSQRRQGRPAALPAKTTSFQRWAEHLVVHAAAARLAAARAYWETALGRPAAALPVDAVAPRNTEGTAGHVHRALSPAQTQALLQEVPGAYGTTITDILLTALVETLHAWTGEAEWLVDLEGHGRAAGAAALDVTRTVGWFTCLYPVRLHLPTERDLGARVKAIKEQLRQVPDEGTSYGLLRYLAGAAPLAATPPAEISFNYLGQFDQLFPPATGFGWAPETPGASRSPHHVRRYLLEINSVVTQGGQLHLDWTYNRHAHHAATIETLATTFTASLDALIRHCQSPVAGGYTPSDFPKIKFTQGQLDDLIDELGQPAED